MVDDLSQEMAIRCPLNSSLFITAPPGYGKTYVLVERIRFIIPQISPPEKILCLTFSNAAAYEMKKRLRDNIKYHDSYVDICNYHTLAYNLLRLYGNYIGLKRSFSIVSEKKKDTFKSDYIRDNISASPRVLYNIRQEYGKWYSHKFLRKNVHYTCKYETEFLDLKSRMDDEFISDDCLDFDNLLLKATDLLRENEKIKNSLYHLYRYVLLDEFQDTNSVQYLFMKEITSNSKGEKRPIFGVGDKKQSIMKFQGATPENIDLMIGDYNCVHLSLENNHRTDSKAILGIAAKLRGDLVDFDPSNTCKMYICHSPDEENTRIISLIREYLQKDVPSDDICILFPQLNLSEKLCVELNKRSIEYFLIPDFKSEAIVNKYSSLFDYIDDAIADRFEGSSVSSFISGLIDRDFSGERNDEILRIIRVFSKQFDNGSYSSRKTWERLQEFKNSLMLDIDWISLVRSCSKGKVVLSTIHGVKGLQFQYVILFGIVNYRLPHSSLCSSCSDFGNPVDVDVSEALDLFYVGVSRATNEVSFIYSERDEHTNKFRKISCLFSNVRDHLEYVDNSNSTHSKEEKGILDLFCKL